MRLLTATALGTAIAILAGVVAFGGLYRAPDPLPPAAAIVVLSGGAAQPGKTDPSTLRTERGIALWQSGAAPRMVMTGGVSATRRMKDLAVAEGVPGAAILVEERAASTLQNALFTADLIGTGDRVLLVTERYHLPRAWASFRWAGFRHVVPVPVEPDPGWRLGWYDLAEVVKWPLNVLRAGAASVALALGVPAGKVEPWLS